MFLISGPELVIEACRAGIVGAFPTVNARTVEELDAWMSRITTALRQEAEARPAATIGPWAANLITHSTNQRLPQDLELVARYRPPVVITALGSPKPAIDLVHSYGGLVIADVVNLTLAKKAIDAGADGLAVVGCDHRLWWPGGRVVGLPWVELSPSSAVPAVEGSAAAGQRAGTGHRSPRPAA